MRLSLPGRKKPYIMGHRGNKVLCPENTLASFRQAISDGADILETDLHLSSDGEIVCIHDSTLNRTTNGRGPVAQKTLRELKELSASCRRPEFEGEKIPTLEELVALIPGDLGLALELKSDAFLETPVCEKLYTILRKANIESRTCILSFSSKRVRATQRRNRNIPTGFITFKRLWPSKEFPLLGPFWPILILNPLYVWVAHHRKQLVCPLDPTPDRRLKFYLSLGIDAILTDNPQATRLALTAETG